MTSGTDIRGKTSGSDSGKRHQAGIRERHQELTSQARHQGFKGFGKGSLKRFGGLFLFVPFIQALPWEIYAFAG